MNLDQKQTRLHHSFTDRRSTIAVPPPSVMAVFSALDVVVRRHGLDDSVTLADLASTDNARCLNSQLSCVHDRDEALRDPDAIIMVTEGDVEPSLARRSWTPVERRRAAGPSSAAWRAGLTHLWTAKRSYAKAVSAGPGLDFRELGAASLRHKTSCAVC